MASISKPPGGKNYVIQFYLNGKKYRRSLKVSVKRDALELKRLIERKLAEGTFDPDALSKRKSREVTTLRELIEKWKAHLARRGDLKTETREGYLLNADILLELCDNMRLIDITQAFVKDELLLDLHARYTSAATIKNKMITFRLLFSFAARHDFVRKNPFAGIVPGYARKLPVWFREAEIEIFKNYWGDASRVKWQQTYFLTLLQTGNRKTEHFNLAWSQNVFLDESCLKFRGKGRYEGKERIVPLNDAALDEFSRAQRKLGEDRVFWQINSTRAIDSAWQRFQKLCDFNYTIHNIRSNRATWLVRAGVSIYKIMKIMGWEDYNTAKVYLSFAQEFLKDERNLVNF